MDTIKVRLNGLSPLLMHSSRAANPLDPEVKKFKLLTGKRKKTDEDHIEIARAEFEIGMWYDPKIGPYLPGENIFRSFIAGGKVSKLGAAMERSVQIAQDKAALVYEGPRTPQELWNEKFYDLRSVVVQQSRTMRCRAKFENWSCDAEVYFDSTMINRDQLVQAMHDAGRFSGMGDYRPTFGRYEIEVLK